MHAYIKQNSRRILISIIGTILFGPIAYSLPFIIMARVPANQVSLVTTLSELVLLLFVVAFMSIIPWRRMFKSTLDRNGQDVSANIDDITEELKVNDLLKSLAQSEWDKKILTIENERLTLQIRWLFSMWKQGPLDLVQISPRSAMMMTWLWLELNTQWLASQLPLFEGEDSAMSKSFDEILDALEMNGDIDYKMVTSLKGMEAFRNRVAAEDTPEIDEDIAASFVLQAFDISKNMKEKLVVVQE